ncbi:MAG: RraA family protein [Alphaproteobacteria bacterium]|nr:RraA family protein [Alphaproteobacteria bacterium]
MIGFRVCARRRKVADEWVARFRVLPVANVSDSMARLSAGGAGLRPMHAGGAMAGVALTVKTRPGDNLMLHHALDIAGPGDVVVVDAGGQLANAMLGEMMALHARRRGLAGIVVNGAIRDADTIRQWNLPIYALGITHRGPYKNGPGEINVPVAIDGMVIQPGDLVIGDGDGVLCVPFDEVPDVCAAAEAKLAAEQKEMPLIEAGRSERGWVLETLRAAGCTFET